MLDDKSKFEYAPRIEPEPIRPTWRELLVVAFVLILGWVYSVIIWALVGQSRGVMPPLKKIKNKTNKNKTQKGYTMIRYTVELNTIDDFNAWSGGLIMLNRVRDAGKIKDLDALLDELSACGGFDSDTQLNDFLWFDLESYAGFSWDELEKAIQENNE